MPPASAYDLLALPTPTVFGKACSGVEGVREGDVPLKHRTSGTALPVFVIGDDHCSSMPMQRCFPTCFKSVQHSLDRVPTPLLAMPAVCISSSDASELDMTNPSAMAAVPEERRLFFGELLREWAGDKGPGMGFDITHASTPHNI